MLNAKRTCRGRGSGARRAARFVLRPGTISGFSSQNSVAALSTPATSFRPPMVVLTSKRAEVAAQPRRRDQRRVDRPVGEILEGAGTRTEERRQQFTWGNGCGHGDPFCRRESLANASQHMV